MREELILRNICHFLIAEKYFLLLLLMVDEYFLQEHDYWYTHSIC